MSGETAAPDSSTASRGDEGVLSRGEAEIGRLTAELGLSESAQQTAMVVYRRAVEAEFLRGRTVEGVATAAVHAGARHVGSPRSLDEVAARSRIDRSRLAHVYRGLVRELDLPVVPPEPDHYVGRVAAELDLSQRTEQRVRELLAEAKTAENHSGKHPLGLVAAAVYAATRDTSEAVVQSRLAEAASVSTVTIRTQYRACFEGA